MTLRGNTSVKEVIPNCIIVVSLNESQMIGTMTKSPVPMFVAGCVYDSITSSMCSPRAYKQGEGNAACTACTWRNSKQSYKCDPV